MAGTVFDFDALPKMQVAAACLFLDEKDRILAVKPTYKSGWDLPGGAVEEGESPLACCRREVQEELGIDVQPVRLLVVDYEPAIPGRRGNALRFVFLGPRLGDHVLARIRLQTAELSEHRFMSLREVREHFRPVAAHRLEACVSGHPQSGLLYLEEGRPALAPAPAD